MHFWPLDQLTGTPIPLLLHAIGPMSMSVNIASDTFVYVGSFMGMAYILLPAD